MALGRSNIFVLFVRISLKKLNKLIEVIRAATALIWNNTSSVLKRESSLLPGSLESIHPELAREILKTGVKEKVEKILKGEE